MKPLTTHPDLMPMLEQLRDNARTEGLIRTKDAFMSLRQEEIEEHIIEARQASFERLSECLYLNH